MNARDWNIIGVTALVLAICCTCGAIGTASSVEDRLAKNYPSAGPATYTCTGTVQATANDIAAQNPPLARQFDSATGTEYLRYKRRIVTVFSEGTTPCRIKVEDLDRFNNGTLVYLGPGFTPSSPSSSSGGSSGSGSGSGSGSSNTSVK